MPGIVTPTGGDLAKKGGKATLRRPWFSPPMVPRPMIHRPLHEHRGFQVVSSLGSVKEICGLGECPTARTWRTKATEWTLICTLCDGPLGERSTVPVPNPRYRHNPRGTGPPLRTRRSGRRGVDSRSPSGTDRSHRMSYRNKTYVIFDGDNDIWAYGFMGGWRSAEHMNFDFYDAHDLSPLTDRASDDTVRSRLRERLGNTKQAIVLIGDHTRHLFKFVRWEIETCLSLDVPIVAANLNGLRRMDPERCPAILRDRYVVHVAFKMGIIQYALDHFPGERARRDRSLPDGDRYYEDSLYAQLGVPAV